MTSRIAVRLVDGRHRTTLTAGLIRAQLVHGPPDRCRIGLLATTALLLGGDEVDLEVELGAGCTVELFDVAGTVAYDGRGAASAWRVRVHVGEAAALRWSGEPFVVSDGASVTRSLEVDLAPRATALVRETVVLGRSGETGGLLHTTVTVRRAGEEVLVEDQLLDPDTHRMMPGMLGGNRVIDTITALGLPGPDDVGTAVRYSLLERGSTVTRYLGDELAESPLHDAWARLRLDGQPDGTCSATTTSPPAAGSSPSAYHRA